MIRVRPSSLPRTTASGRPELVEGRVFAGTALLVVIGCLMVFAQGRVLKPVTEAMLESPDPAEWLSWRRTLDGWGYSPLNQINKNNVGQLQLVWSWGLAPGQSQPTPLVHDEIG